MPAIEDPDGTLVPDQRDPVFHVPSWVTVPDFLAPHLAARNATTTTDLPYDIQDVLHFSNGGGLYRGPRPPRPAPRWYSRRPARTPGWTPPGPTR